MQKTFFAFLIVPFFLAACTQNNVTEDKSLGKYFDSAGVKGCFGFFDNGQGHFTIYNLPRYRDSSFLPAETFDIVQSLIALQTGVLTNENSEPVHLREAFQNPQGQMAFMALARQIGKDTLKKWIDSLHYGNRNIGGSVDSFWLNNHLKITPDEELGLVKKMYFDQLAFFQRTQKIVRGMMLRESTTNYQLSYKTGWGFKEDGHSIGWMVGWIEENTHPYFFVLNLESADPHIDMMAVRMRILKGILGQMGFFAGKK